MSWPRVKTLRTFEDHIEDAYPQLIKALPRVSAWCVPDRVIDPATDPAPGRPRLAQIACKVCSVVKHRAEYPIYKDGGYRGGQIKERTCLACREALRGQRPCSQCGVVKPLSGFHLKYKSVVRRSTVCKVCKVQNRADGKTSTGLTDVNWFKVGRGRGGTM
jgi:hypothetical protein